MRLRGNKKTVGAAVGERVGERVVGAKVGAKVGVGNTIELATLLLKVTFI